MIKRKRIGILIMSALIIFSGIFGWREYTRKNGPVTALNAVFKVPVPRFIQEFEANDAAATSKYLGKLIAVSGMIRKIDTDGKGFFTVVLGDAGVTSSVRCAMDSLFANEVITLQPGQTITIKGMFTGFQRDDTGLLGSDVILNRCVVDKMLTNKQD